MKWCEGNYWKNTSVMWKKRGMYIDTILYPSIAFVVRVISHKFFQSSWLNSVSCMVVDFGFKIVERDHSYGLAELQLHQVLENLEAIRKEKKCIMKIRFFTYFHILLCKKHLPHLWHSFLEDQQTNNTMDLRIHRVARWWFWFSND